MSTEGKRYTLREVVQWMESEGAQELELHANQIRLVDGDPTAGSFSASWFDGPTMTQVSDRFDRAPFARLRGLTLDAACLGVWRHTLARREYLYSRIDVEGLFRDQARPLETATPEELRIVETMAVVCKKPAGPWLDTDVFAAIGVAGIADLADVEGYEEWLEFQVPEKVREEDEPPF